MENVTDPACGMTVDAGSARSSSYQGEDYFFCSESCRQKFDGDPSAVLAKAAQREAERQEETQSTDSCCCFETSMPGSSE